jgi:hypothetical protein
MSELPLFMSCREGVFSETRIQPVVSLVNRTGARRFATLSQHRLLHAVGSYRVWNATDSLKVLQKGGNELPTNRVLGNSRQLWEHEKEQKPKREGFGSESSRKRV